MKHKTSINQLNINATIYVTLAASKLNSYTQALTELLQEPSNSLSCILRPNKSEKMPSINVPKLIKYEYDPHLLKLLVK